MAFFDSKSSTFKIDKTAGGALEDISAYIDDIGGLPGPRNVNPVTALGDAGVKSIPSLEDVTITIAGTYDDTVSVGPDAIFGPLRTATVTLSFEYSPDGTRTYTGECWITDYTIKSAVGSRVSYSVTLQVDGTVTRP